MPNYDPETRTYFGADETPTAPDTTQAPQTAPGPDLKKLLPYGIALLAVLVLPKILKKGK